MIEYGVPSREVARQVLRARLALVKLRKVDWDEVLDAAAGLSHAELTRACEQVAKNALLARRTDVAAVKLVAAIGERKATHL